MTQALELKQIAPAFSMPDAEGVLHSSADLAGKPIVLIFYPGDMTPGCTLQLCDIRDQWSGFTALGAAVFGVNPASAESHQAFRAATHLPFPLLIDKKSKVAAAYGAIRRFLGLSLIRRTVVVIGPDGKIAYYRRGLPKTSEILKAVQQAAARTSA